MAQHEDYYSQKHHQSKLDHSANSVLNTDQYPTLKAAIPLSYSYLDKRNNSYVRDLDYWSYPVPLGN